MAGADYHAAAGSFDMASCLGASWAFGGHRCTLQYLTQAVRPGGVIVTGEPFWKKQPDPEYLASSGLAADTFGTHAGNVEVGVSLGLKPLLALVSSDHDWDYYETLQWNGATRYATAHPEDPDVPELLARVEKDRREYLNWGRDTMGWALYVFARQSD